MKDNLTVIKQSLDEALTTMSDILDDTKLSKGMKVAKLTEAKTKLNGINATLDDMIKTEKMTATIDGRVSLNLLTSNNDFRYQVKGFEHLFVIEVINVVDADNTDETKANYRLTLSNSEPSPFINTSLPDVIGEAFIALLHRGDITEEFLKENFSTSMLVHRVLANFKPKDK